ncbi:MAG: class I SAM-dependent methyltransferase [Novosphingobium sp.]
MASKEHGNSLGDAYRRWRGSLLGRITDRREAELIDELMGDVQGLDVLDVGCGDGALMASISYKGANVTGVDPDDAMLAAARQRAEASGLSFHLLSGSAEALPFADCSFDRIVGVTVLCFIEKPDIAIAEMARVLRPGGEIILGELGKTNIWAAVRRIKGWLGSPVWRAARFRNAAELRRLLTRRGLRTCTVRGAIFYPPIGLAAMAMGAIDNWLGRHLTEGAAFIAIKAQKGPERSLANSSFRSMRTAEQYSATLAAG